MYENLWIIEWDDRGRDGEAIGQARHAVRVLQRELATGFVGRLSAMPPLTIGWLQADWTDSLPFRTGSLDRLVCNLSLPYVHSPFAALREWHRVLYPEGSLIVTTFHAQTDLSTLFRRHLRQANQDEFSAQAQPLLHYFARLREAIRHGILHTFDEAGLDALLRQCGMTIAGERSTMEEDGPVSLGQIAVQAQVQVRFGVPYSGH